MAEVIEFVDLLARLEVYQLNSAQVGLDGLAVNEGRQG